MYFFLGGLQVFDMLQRSEAPKTETFKSHSDALKTPGCIQVCICENVALRNNGTDIHICGLIVSNQSDYQW